jgi:hypothetical protein
MIRGRVSGRAGEGTRALASSGLVLGCGLSINIYISFRCGTGYELEWQGSEAKMIENIHAPKIKLDKVSELENVCTTHLVHCRADNRWKCALDNGSRTHVRVL